MSSNDCAGGSSVAFEADHGEAAAISSAPIQRGVRLLTVVLGAASLVACAQSSVVSRRSAFLPA
ncbi:MAG: hypothetical protein WCB02_42225, partial [Bradyrhizobium sp.]